jgi:hypothetical protein
MSRTEELEQQVQHLTRVIEDMKTRVVRLEAADEAVAESDPPRKTRRNFLKLGAATAVGAVGMLAGRAIPAAAADGATVMTGATVTGEHPTIIAGDAVTAVPVLAAHDSTFSPTALTTAGGFAGTLRGNGGATGTIEGVDGWAQGPQAYGVYGLTDSGTGVVGESNTGIGLHARRSGRIRQDPLGAAPAYLPDDFEQVRDPSGNLWVSQAGGVWRQVSIMHLFQNPRRVWDGFVGPTVSGVYGPVDATTIVASQGGGPSGVPVGAQAAWCAVMSYQAGVMTIFPDLTSEPIIGNWANGVTGPLGIFYMFVPLSPAGKFKFHAFFTGNRFFDVWGYLL